MAGYNPNFGNLGGMRAVTLDARDVPLLLWETLQAAQRDLVEAQLLDALPENADTGALTEAFARADVIAGAGNVREYARRRQHPNAYRGLGGTNRRQLYRDPRWTIVFDQEDWIAGAVGTVRNTSPSKGRSLLAGIAEQHVKMWSTPESRFGGHRYEKITDVIIVDEPAAALAALDHRLRRRPEMDYASTFHSDDPADAEVGWLIEATGMELRDHRPRYGLAGFEDGIPEGRYVRRIGDMLRKVRELPGAPEAIDNMPILDGLPQRWV